ncbi:MAG: GNAT family N-acetyltransferase [Acetobacteraceae bacterium]|nr:GNAT family N-acetyltransferase [Acetobacteraceae bacterium]
MSTTLEIPTLRTRRLLLRAFRATDIEPFAAMEADPAVRQFRGGHTLDRTQAWTAMQLLLGQWPLRGYGVFALAAPQDGRFLGFAGVLHPADWPEPEIAYSLDRPHWGQGLASEAAGAVRDWAFEQIGASTLASFIHSGNERSKRVAAGLGAVLDGSVTLRGMAVERWVWPAPGRGVVA